MKVIKILGLTLVFISFVSLLVNEPLAAESGTIKIGIIAAFNTSPGDGIINGAKFAIEDINNSGGILGKKVELVIENSEFNPQKGIMAFKKLLLDDKVIGIIGESSSGVARSSYGSSSQI